MIDIILSFIILALIILSAYFVSRKLYKTFTAKGNKYALAISISGFVLSLALIMATIIFLAVYNMRFER